MKMLRKLLKKLMNKKASLNIESEFLKMVYVFLELNNNFLNLMKDVWDHDRPLPLIDVVYFKLMHYITKRQFSRPSHLHISNESIMVKVLMHILLTTIFHECQLLTTQKVHTSQVDLTTAWENINREFIFLSVRYVFHALT